MTQFALIRNEVGRAAYFICYQHHRPLDAPESGNVKSKDLILYGSLDGSDAKAVNLYAKQGVAIREINLKSPVYSTCEGIR
jgi:hypothetical protein